MIIFFLLSLAHSQLTCNYMRGVGTVEYSAHDMCGYKNKIGLFNYSKFSVYEEKADGSVSLMYSITDKKNYEMTPVFIGEKLTVYGSIYCASETDCGTDGYAKVIYNENEPQNVHVIGQATLEQLDDNIQETSYFGYRVAVVDDDVSTLIIVSAPLSRYNNQNSKGVLGVYHVSSFNPINVKPMQLVIPQLYDYFGIYIFVHKSVALVETSRLLFGIAEYRQEFHSVDGTSNVLKLKYAVSTFRTSPCSFSDNYIACGVNDNAYFATMDSSGSVGNEIKVNDLSYGPCKVSNFENENSNSPPLIDETESYVFFHFSNLMFDVNSGSIYSVKNAGGIIVATTNGKLHAIFVGNELEENKYFGQAIAFTNKYLFSSSYGLQDVIYFSKCSYKNKLSDGQYCIDCDANGCKSKRCMEYSYIETTQGCEKCLEAFPTENGYTCHFCEDRDCKIFTCDDGYFRENKTCKDDSNSACNIYKSKGKLNFDKVRFHVGHKNKIGYYFLDRLQKNFTIMKYEIDSNGMMLKMWEYLATEFIYSLYMNDLITAIGTVNTNEQIRNGQAIIILNDDKDNMISIGYDSIIKVGIMPYQYGAQVSVTEKKDNYLILVSAPESPDPSNGIGTVGIIGIYQLTQRNPVQVQMTQIISSQNLGPIGYFGKHMYSYESEVIISLFSPYEYEYHIMNEKKIEYKYTIKTGDYLCSFSKNYIACGKMYNLFFGTLNKIDGKISKIVLDDVNYLPCTIQDIRYHERDNSILTATPHQINPSETLVFFLASSLSFEEFKEVGGVVIFNTDGTFEGLYIADSFKLKNFGYSVSLTDQYSFVSNDYDYFAYSQDNYYFTNCLIKGERFYLDPKTNECISCSTKHIVENGICSTCNEKECTLIKCDTGYYQDGKECKDCLSKFGGIIENKYCHECDFQKCLKYSCVDGFYLDPKTNECISCSTKHNVENGICSTCDDKECTLIKCDTGYYLVGNKCSDKNENSDSNGSSDTNGSSDSNEGNGSKKYNLSKLIVMCVVTITLTNFI